MQALPTYCKIKILCGFTPSLSAEFPIHRSVFSTCYSWKTITFSNFPVETSTVYQRSVKFLMSYPAISTHFWHSIWKDKAVWLSRWSQNKTLWEFVSTSWFGTFDLNPTETQPCYKAPSDLQMIEQEIALWLTSSDWGCFLIIGPKLTLGEPKSWYTNFIYIYSKKRWTQENY